MVAIMERARPLLDPCKMVDGLSLNPDGYSLGNLDC